MRYRWLGNTGLKVSEIGFGAWAIGGAWWGPQDDSDSRLALHQALDMGCNFIDTAWVYGDGHSERLIGEVLKERRESPIVATKVPPKNWQWDNAPGTPLSSTFPGDWVKQKAEESLAHLGLERIDVLQLHTWHGDWNRQAEPLLKAVGELKREGKIRAFGISLRDKGSDEANDLIRWRQVDSLQIFFNLFYQEPIRKVFPLAQTYNVGVIARVPLAFGALSGRFTEKTRFLGDDHRARLYTGEGMTTTLKKVKKLDFLKDRSRSLADASILWTLAHPAVSTSIPGIRNPSQARTNCRVGDLPPLPSLAVKKSQALYTKNFGLPVKPAASLEGVPAVLISGFKAGKVPSVKKKAGKRTARKPVRRPVKKGKGKRK
ncbi:MAG TPA: aldo/keto reductase [bacterium]|nr:aldo/keto reductase [bacterium]